MILVRFNASRLVVDDLKGRDDLSRATEWFQPLSFCTRRTEGSTRFVHRKESAESWRELSSLVDTPQFSSVVLRSGLRVCETGMSLAICRMSNLIGLGQWSRRITVELVLMSRIYSPIGMIARVILSGWYLDYIGTVS